MKFTSLFAAALAVGVMFSAQAEEITIHGSTTVDANLFKPYKTELEEKTGLTLKVVANGSSRGIKGIDSGAAQIGMISADLESVLRKLKLTERAGEFSVEQVGEERITFSVHASNPVKALTKEQVVQILNGTVKTWDEVGGEAKPITVVTEYSGGGFRTTAEKKLLNKEAISAPMLKEFPNGPQAVKVGQQIPTAFVVAPSTMIKGSSLVKIETEAEIVQPLNLVVKGEKTDAFNKLVAAAKELLK